MTEKTFSVKIQSGDRTITAVDDFVIPEDCITFLFGESGIGKSMISKAVYGLLDPSGLNITVNSGPYLKHLKDPWTKAVQRTGFFVFQEPSSHLNSLMRISQQLDEGSLAHAKGGGEILQYLWQTQSSQTIQSITKVFPKPFRPSGGEKQRVLLAMAFKKIELFLRLTALRLPNLFVFDEPTGSLDDNYRNLFLKLLFDRYREKPFTVLLITHDYSIISEVFKSHESLVDKVRFKELSRKKEDEVTLNDFSPNDYLDWLKDRQSRGPTGQEEAVLRVAPKFRIFNRPLSIFRDPKHQDKTDLVIRKGEMVYLKAPSGIGKTTLAKIVMGLYGPQRFQMELGGLRVTERSKRRVFEEQVWGKRAGMVFQHADEALNLEATVRETFSGLPMQVKLTGQAIKRVLSELFDTAITEPFLNKKVRYLSGGQKQRLNLLRTMVLCTDLVILDEPLNGLDFISIKKVLAMIEHRRAQGSAFLMISHNEEIFDSVVDEGGIFYLALDE
jgi:peptide/nickel transport system ATP-binding protein